MIRRKAGSNPVEVQAATRQRREAPFIALKNLFAAGSTGKRATAKLAAALGMEAKELAAIESGRLNMDSEDLPGLRRLVKARAKKAGPLMRPVAAAIDLDVLGQPALNEASQVKPEKKRGKDPGASKVKSLLRDTRTISPKEALRALQQAGVFNSGRALFVHVQDGVVVVVKPPGSVAASDGGENAGLSGGPKKVSLLLTLP